MDVLKLLWSCTPHALGVAERGLDFIQVIDSNQLLTTDGTIFFLYTAAEPFSKTGYFLPKDKTDKLNPLFSKNILNISEAVKMYPDLRVLQLKDPKDPFGVLESPAASRYNWLTVKKDLPNLEGLIADNTKELLTLTLASEAYIEGVSFGVETKGTFPTDPIFIESRYIAALVNILKQTEVDKAICIFFVKEINGKTGKFLRFQTKQFTVYISLLY